MTIQTPTADRPRPNNDAPAARDDAEYDHTCPNCQACYQRGWEQGRRRGRIDAWQQYAGHTIPGADPIPAEPITNWPAVWQAVRALIFGGRP